MKNKCKDCKYWEKDEKRSRRFDSELFECRNPGVFVSQIIGPFDFDFGCIHFEPKR